MTDATVGFLLENVKELCLYHYKLSSESESELKNLKANLEELKGFLQDAAQRYDKGEAFKQLEKQIREAVYEMEDTIDSCVTKAVGGSKFISWLNTKISLAKEVRSLREGTVKPLVDAARTAVHNMNIAGPAAGSGVHDTKDHAPKAPLLREDNVVGFDDEADKIIGYLSEEKKEVEVISIIGMPGLGKTTLAWMIYRDPRIRYEFPTLIWVYVSQEFNRKELFLNIMKKFTKQDMSRKDEQELIEILRGYLEAGKFLLFMDDVWTTDAWDLIKPILPKGNGSSKVLITSRHKEVGSHANLERNPHQLRFLTQKESWELLQLEVFGKDGTCPEILEWLGKDIAYKCKGVPLAIVVIGGILQKKYATKGEDIATKREWEKVAESVGSYLNEDRMENIISLSYNKLPYNLRDCFLYLGMFPEDYEIPAWKLIRLWIAEGFVQEDPRKHEQCLEEIAEENLEELINRNLLMVDKMKPDGEVKTCRVHDMIREFCRNEAGFKEQNLFQEIRMSKDSGVFVPQVSEIGRYRRLCIHSYVWDFLQKKPKGPHVRSLLCFSKEPIQLPKEHIHTIPVAFNLLRVLDAVPIRFSRFPAKITLLFHLRYIALYGDDFNIIPDAISKLWNVQTITVDTSSSRTLKIDADILNMKQLRHFKTKASIILNKNGKGDPAEYLQTLGRLSPDSCTEEVLERAKNLKILGIRGKLEALLADSKSLEKLVRLEKLKLVNDVFPLPAKENPLKGLPQPHKFPPKLRILTLSGTYLEWKNMSTLEGVHTLEVLKLKDNAFTGSFWDADGDGFRSLQFLHIERVDLQFWKVSEKGFPKLGCLVLKKCKKLDQVPLGLAKSLKKLDMERVTKSAVASAREIEEKKKKEMPGQQVNKRGGFKLIIAPGDE
ncbi:hypothetical protein BUALT_Bualt02G0153900 [Buddleja alternifolia]|uniref:Uncharacterized protein n=1 Tax=Buddleja alternifolia TaxID=168488 RepID=A0AAV6Y932_9LAMI|nr:hypothetical protein BUALT_Bualt02G0153900 [Buddleja alternifolia]